MDHRRQTVWLLAVIHFGCGRWLRGLQPIQKVVATLIFVRLTQGQKSKRVPSGATDFFLWQLC